MKVLIVGGYGAFGTRIARRLMKIQGIDVVIGGRSYEKARRAFPAAEFKCVDIFDANLSKQFVGIDLVINTAGPFDRQSESYNVAKACIAASVSDQPCHYIDLADNTDYVLNISSLDRQAAAKGCVLLTGASTAPALTTAAVTHFAPSFFDSSSRSSNGGRNSHGITTADGVRHEIGSVVSSGHPTWADGNCVGKSRADLTRIDRLQEVDIRLSVANSAMPGKGTVKSILSYCGQTITLDTTAASASSALSVGAQISRDAGQGIDNPTTGRTAYAAQELDAFNRESSAVPNGQLYPTQHQHQHHHQVVRGWRDPVWSVFPGMCKRRLCADIDVPDVPIFTKHAHLPPSQTSLHAVNENGLTGSGTVPNSGNPKLERFRFRAGVESFVSMVGLSLMARITEKIDTSNGKVRINWSLFSSPLLFINAGLRWFDQILHGQGKAHEGGMVVVMTGVRDLSPNQSRGQQDQDREAGNISSSLISSNSSGGEEHVRVQWAVHASEATGPEIPCTPAVILAQKFRDMKLSLRASADADVTRNIGRSGPGCRVGGSGVYKAKGGWSFHNMHPGARPCVGAVSLEEFSAAVESEGFEMQQYVASSSSRAPLSSFSSQEVADSTSATAATATITTPSFHASLFEKQGGAGLQGGANKATAVAAGSYAPSSVFASLDWVSQQRLAPAVAHVHDQGGVVVGNLRICMTPIAPIRALLAFAGLPIPRKQEVVDQASRDGTSGGDGAAASATSDSRSESNIGVGEQFRVVVDMQPECWRRWFAPVSGLSSPVSNTAGSGTQSSSLAAEKQGASATDKNRLYLFPTGFASSSGRPSDGGQNGAFSDGAWGQLLVEIAMGVFRYSHQQRYISPTTADGCSTTNPKSTIASNTTTTSCTGVTQEAERTSSHQQPSLSEQTSHAPPYVGFEGICKSASLMGLVPVPMALMAIPHYQVRPHPDGLGWDLHLEIRMPLLGRIVSYDGPLRIAYLRSDASGGGVAADSRKGCFTGSESSWKPPTCYGAPPSGVEVNGSNDYSQSAAFLFRSCYQLPQDALSRLELQGSALVRDDIWMKLLGKHVLVYDGDCALCDSVISWLIKRDPNNQVVFGDRSSSLSADLLDVLGISPHDFERLRDQTIFVIDPFGRISTYSRAVTSLLVALGGGWATTGHVMQAALPRSIADAMYSLVATYRYRVFGKVEACAVTRSDRLAQHHRFL